MLSFGQRMRMLRKEAGLTQNDLAEKLLVSVQSISKWECDNTMPDISQIVPLAAVLNVTTDCLLGVGTDEKADRERLEKEIEDIVFNNGDERGYENSSSRKACVVYREYLKKYPLDYQAKLGLVHYLGKALSCSRRFFWKDMPKEDEKKFYNESLKLIQSILNQDHDPHRLIEAKIYLVELYTYNNEFEKAEATALELPDIYSLRKGALIPVYEKQKEREKCLALAEELSRDCTLLSMYYLKQRAKKISVFGNVRKLEALKAWGDLEIVAKANHSIMHNDDTFWFVLRSLWGRSNDCIAISDFDGALTAIEEMRDFGVEYYIERKNAGADDAELESITIRMQNQLKKGYSLTLSDPDNIINNDPRFKACQQTFIDLDAERNKNE